MPRILVIEDEDIIREDIMIILSMENYDVRGAEDGRSGLQEIYDFQPDLIICDVMMPGIDGFSVLSEVRRQAPALPFIFLSALTDNSYVKKAMAMGASQYLMKPFTMAELINTVKSYF